jgi:predicted deacylase
MTAPSRRRVETGPDADAGFTIVEVAGRRGGPTVSVVGGVHGDEFEGVMACLRLADELADDDVRGRIRLVPVAHESAHVASTRASPIDGLNLARTFPGDPNGRPTERLADALRRHVIEGSDAFVDLHSAGTAYAMPLLVGWTDDGCATCAASGDIAGAFGAPVLWRHPGAVPPGRTLSVAHAAGIPSVYAEAAGGGTLTAAHVDAYVAGVRRILASFDMLTNADDPPTEAPIRLAGEGDLDVPAMIAPFDGVCETYVVPLDAVEPGQVVAAVTDPSSGIREEVRSPTGGVVVLARRGARVARADNLVVLAEADGSIS